MPPAAIARSVASVISRSPRSIRNSSAEAWGNFGAAPKPPSWRSKDSRSRSTALLSEGSPIGCEEGSSSAPPERRSRRLLAAGADLVAALAPGLGDRLQNLCPRGHPVSRLRWEVRASVERQLLGREEHVQRPAALAGHALHGLHVERVHVRALLAVDLHADELLVHQRRRLLVLEGLALHHVAPVARGVADRDEQRLVSLGGTSQRLLTPR